MKRTIFFLTIAALLLSACGGVAPVSSEEPMDDDPLNQPVSSDDPLPTPAIDVNPQPGDSALRRENADVEQTDLLIMESYPPQFSLSLKGSLPTPCNQLRVAVSPADDKNQIMVDVYSVVDPAVMCAEVIQPFEVNVPLGSFPEGKYTVWINGEKVTEFDA